MDRRRTGAWLWQGYSSKSKHIAKAMNDVELKENLDAIPLQLRTKFAPLLRAQFRQFGANDFLEGIKKIHEEFNKAGGTDDQWNVMAPAIYHGKYDRIYPTPTSAV
jgi:hypothetical protein